MAFGLTRARLNERLERATRFPVTLIAAPAGFGKTVALRDYLAHARIDAVRYDVRPEDATLFAFARGLSGALADVVPSLRGAFPATQERLLASDDATAELADWFDSHLKRVVCTIVIDDLHFAAVDRNVPALLGQLIDRTRGRVSWIVATRSDAGLPVASWIGYGIADTPIGEEDLRFTLEEALGAGRGDVDATEIETLRVLTSGWPIALTIALRMRTNAADLRSAAATTRDMIYRYLAEQVFARLEERERQLLLATSVLPSFDVASVEALGGTVETIGQLRRDVAFVVPYGNGAFRYHDLFRAFLESELDRLGELNVALRRASDIIASRDPATALRLSTRAADRAAILSLLERNAFALIERGHADAVGAAVDLLDESERAKSAVALGARATLLAARGSFDVAEPSFVAAIARASDRRLRAKLVNRYAIELVRHGRDCEPVVSEDVADTSLESSLRAPLLGTLATALSQRREGDRAEAVVREALDLLEPETDEDVRARVLQQTAFVLRFRAPDDALRYARMAIELADARNLFEVAARAYSVIYTIAYDRDDVPGALAALDSLLESARKGASNQAVAFALIGLFGIEVERGNEATLEVLDADLARISAQLSAREEALVPARALRATWTSDFAHARDLLRDTAEQLPRSDWQALRWAELALYAVASGSDDEATAAARACEEAIARHTGPSSRVARARVTLALAELSRAHNGAAHRELQEAQAALGSCAGRTRALLQCARVLYRVRLGQADEAELAGALERLRSENFGGMARLIAALPVRGQARSGIALLTPSERRILELLARGASTKDVAAQTGRSPQTVDTHIRSICRKLEVSGRRAAVAQAAAAGWFA